VDVFAPVRFAAGTSVDDATDTLRGILTQRHSEERAAIAAGEAAGSFDRAA